MSPSQTAARSTGRVTWTIFTYLYFVVLVAVILPVMARLEYRNKIHIGWLQGEGKSLLPAAIILALAFLLFARQIFRICTKIAAWIMTAPQDRNRWVIVGVPLLIFTSYAWQLHIGIAHRGVPGWDYNDLPPVITPAQPSNLTFPPKYDQSVFYAALQPAVLPYVRRSGFATNDVMFLHFKDGTMRPANLQLAMVSWPRATFGLDEKAVKHGDAFLALVRQTFDRRRSGGAFLLPDQISYPSHLTYQKIDYSKYPPAADLDGVSLWSLSIHVDSESNKMEIVGVQPIASVGAQ